MAKRDNSKRRQFPGQHADEEILAVTRQFPLVLRWPLIWGLLIIAISLAPWAIAYSNNYNWLNLAILWMIINIIILIVYWLIRWISWYYSVYILTNYRIITIKQNGLFNREVSELTLNNIQNVNYQIKGIQASFFKFGNVIIETLSGGGDLELKKIYRPIRFQQKILNTAHKLSSTQTQK
ncbi:MAG: PH domain-containing protein [bacterium]|nr:PH domain-containing protein [bacterium]